MRELARATGADIKSWSDSFVASVGVSRPARTFLLQVRGISARLILHGPWSDSFMAPGGISCPARTFLLQVLIFLWLMQNKTLAGPSERVARPACAFLLRANSALSVDALACGCADTIHDAMLQAAWNHSHICTAISSAFATYCVSFAF